MEKTNVPQLFRSPFSAQYWRLACGELKNTRMLVFAALMIALRVVFKAVRIPVGPYLDINTAFVVNALGAMSFGPVVAVFAAVITDTLGCLLFPSGPYFFPFIFVEIAGSLIFALFLYRTEVTPGRIIWARFCIDFGVNILLQTPIMALYYQMILGKYYTLVDLPRIVKNLALFPFEAAVLIVLLGYLIPPLNRQGVVQSRAVNLRLTSKTIAVLAGLVLLSVAAVAGYTVYSYNTTSLTVSWSAEKRLERNMTLGDVAASQRQEPSASFVTIIDRASSTWFSPEIEYSLTLYRVDDTQVNARLAEGGKGMSAIWGYSPSRAKKDGALTPAGKAVVVLGKDDDVLIRYTEEPLSDVP